MAAFFPISVPTTATISVLIIAVTVTCRTLHPPASLQGSSCHCTEQCGCTPQIQGPHKSFLFNELGFGVPVACEVRTRLRSRGGGLPKGATGSGVRGDTGAGRIDAPARIFGAISFWRHGGGICDHDCGGGRTSGKTSAETLDACHGGVSIGEHGVCRCSGIAASRSS